MKVRMLTCMSGLSGVRKPGDVVDLTPEIADAWVKAGISALVSEGTEQATVHPNETPEAPAPAKGPKAPQATGARKRKGES